MVESLKKARSAVGTPENPTCVAELPETMHNNFRGWAMRNHKMLCNLYTSCTLIAIVTCVVAMATSGWYTSYDRSVVSSSSDSNNIVRTADYAFSILGLTIDISYCIAEGPLEGECATSISQFRYFDDEKNNDSTKWRHLGSGQFADPSSDCKSTSEMLLSCGVVSLLLSLATWILVMVTRCSVNAFTWWVIGPAATCALVAAVLMSVAATRFVLSLDELTSGLEQNGNDYQGIVEQTLPDFKLNYGVWCVAIGMFFQWSLVVLMYFIIPPLTSAAELAALAVSQERKDRDKRIKKYAQFTVSGETSLSLEPPREVEHIGNKVERSAPRKVGWSKGIGTRPPVFSSESIKQDLETGLARKADKQAPRKENRRSSLPDMQLRNMKVAPWLIPGDHVHPRRSSVPVMGSPTAPSTIPGMVPDPSSKSTQHSEPTESAETNSLTFVQQIDPEILAANARHELAASKKARES